MAELFNFERRAAAIRKIAAGIFDKRDRKLVLDFLADLESAAAKPRTKGNGSLALERNVPLRDAALFDALPDD